MRRYTFIYFLLLLISCKNNQNEPTSKVDNSEVVSHKTNTFFQYNIWSAFVNKVFDGHMTIAELKTKGNIGLGSFDLLDGELVMVDGIAYRIREDGTVTVGKDTDEIVYADATFFSQDTSFKLAEHLDFNKLRVLLNNHLPSPNHFYAMIIRGEFQTMKVGGLHRQSPPFNVGLDVLIPGRPVFEGKNIDGTLIGFYCPSFIGDINTAGYHFHFISDDKKLGGHVMELQSKGSLDVAIDKLMNYEFRMPESSAFDTVRFDKQFQYNKK